MRNSLKNEILNSLGNGLLKLLVGLAGSGKSHFLFHDLFNELSACSDYQIIEIRQSVCSDLATLLLRVRKEHDKRVIVLIDDIFLFEHPESLFDACAGQSDVDVIATSDLEPSFALGEKETLIRGRFQRFAFTPVSYIDSLKSGSVKSQEEYLERGGLFVSKDECLAKAIEEGRQLKKFRGDYSRNIESVFRYSLNRCGTPLTVNQTRVELESKLSINTFLSYFDFLKGANLLQMLPRENVETEQTNARSFALYPTDVRFQGEKRNRAVEDKTMILSKLTEESYRISSGYVYGKFDGTFQALDVAFVLRKGRDKIYLSYGGSDGSKEAETMAMFLKDSYLKIVVIPIEVAPWKDGSGTIHMGLEHFLRLGLSDFAGGQVD